VKEKSAAARELYELLQDAVAEGKRGDYELCTAIVDAFRQCKGDEAAKRARRVLWEMIKEPA
jgi:hypothetical protein